MNELVVVEAVRDEIRRVPARQGDLQGVIRRGGRRRLSYQLGVSSLVAAVVALVVGVGLNSGISSMPVASDGTIQLGSDFRVPVIGDPVRSQGALVYEAAPGPAPSGINLDGLGTELTVGFGDPGNLVVPTSALGGNSLEADRIVYLGDLGQAQLALHEFEGQICVYLGNGTAVAGGGYCGVKGLFGGIGQVDPPIGDWLVWTQLPEMASVVTGQTPGGQRYWQRVTGRTVAFILPDGSTLAPESLSALDADGNELATTSGSSFADMGLPTIECPRDLNEEGTIVEDCKVPG